MKKVKNNLPIKNFLKGYIIGAAFCGGVALMLLIALWIFI